MVWLKRYVGLTIPADQTQRSTVSDFREEGDGDASAATVFLYRPPGEASGARPGGP